MVVKRYINNTISSTLKNDTQIFKLRQSKLLFIVIVNEQGVLRRHGFFFNLISQPAVKICFKFKGVYFLWVYLLKAINDL